MIHLRENKLAESDINEIISDVASKVLKCEIDDDPSRDTLRDKEEEIVDMENKIISKLNEIKKHEIEERKFLNKIKNIKQV